MGAKHCWALTLGWFLLSGSCCTNANAAKTIAPNDAPYIVDVWGLEDGLPESAIISVAQTYDGYLWLGTPNGLVRFDGDRFTVFDQANTPGLSSSPIVHLFEDAERNLWVATESDGVALFTKEGEMRKLAIGKGGRDSAIVSSCQETNGAVWLLARDGLYRYLGGKIDVKPPGGKVVIAEKSGPVWLGADQGLFAIAKASDSSAGLFLEQQQPIERKLDFLFASPRGGYWRLADGRIQKWAGGKTERDLGAYPWSTNTLVTAACEDANGNLIVGTYGEGVFWFDSRGKFTQLSDVLSHSFVLSLVMDREGNLWIGTNGGGLNRVKRKMFQVVVDSAGKTVQSITEDGQGSLWIGYNGNRIDSLKGGITHEFTPVASSEGQPQVKAVLADRNQRVWAGIWTTGNRLFEFKQGRFQPIQGVVFNQDISVLHQDRRGHLWVGTMRGLTCWDQQAWKVFTTREGLPANEVRAIADDPQGNLWVATSGGLARFRDGAFTAVGKLDESYKRDLSSLYADNDGVLWIGTLGSGLGRLQGDQWTHYTTREGLSGNSISYMIEDGQGNFWIGSNAGLMRTSKRALNAVASGATNFVHCRVYLEADGLPTRECTRGSQPAACLASDGKLWFPTTKGAVSIVPAEIKPNSYPPPVVIEAALIGRQQITNHVRSKPLASVTVPPGTERLDIHYTCLNLGAANRSLFRYQMVGHEETPVEVGNTRVARYPKLPPGEYQFQVQACNEDGVWNVAGGSLAVTVLPAFWQTRWFVALSVGLLLAIVVAVVRYLSTQKLQRQLAGLKQQEALELERARIARDLHDQLGANLTQVALLGEMAEADKEAPGEVESHARQISQTARETTQALDEIVWAVNPSNDTLEGLFTYACKYAQEYVELAGLRYRLDVPAQLPHTPIPPEVRHNLFLAFKEAVNNVVKHAQATAVSIRLRQEDSSFTLEIVDDGQGLKGVEGKADRSGLRNMRKRMEDIGGRFSIGPGPEGGTVVRLTAKLGR